MLLLNFLLLSHSAGVLNGNVGVIKSSLGELSDHTNEARAFSYLPPSWTLGAALGPIIGGFLADPAKNYPEYFGKSAFFLKYRYALPCFVGAIFPIIGIVVGVLFLKEVSRTHLVAYKYISLTATLA